jgi:hypothetical protein
MPIAVDTWLELTQRATVRLPLPKTSVNVCFFSTDGILFRTDRQLEPGAELTVSFGGKGRTAKIDHVALDEGMYLTSAHWQDAA